MTEDIIKQEDDDILIYARELNQIIEKLRDVFKQEYIILLEMKKVTKQKMLIVSMIYKFMEILEEQGILDTKLIQALLRPLEKYIKSDKDKEDKIVKEY